MVNKEGCYNAVIDPIVCSRVAPVLQEVDTALKVLGPET